MLALVPQDSRRILLFFNRLKIFEDQIFHSSQYNLLSSMIQTAEPGLAVESARKIWNPQITHPRQRLLKAGFRQGFQYQSPAVPAAARKNHLFCQAKNGHYWPIF